ncbi:uncharacterized protein LOC113067463 isoform X1 [Carassius auratus]|uniref:Uncharacterized protein LOC113067463 isoform X1 n=1 Tax=Carassius auratus TaxID=7957 RepID=A0A6P6MG37_CARAU|nr:uncharacterized protein LOC113067463 isoform X1 [Carassius auratus]XP_026095670.1 uncharacterized protein LOC113067463 isoform X1 [Carassius auratus]
MWIEEEQICTVDEMLPPSVRPVTGISSTHQVLSFAPGKILAVSARIQGCAPVTSCTNLSLTMFSLMRCQVTRQVMTVAHLLKCPLSNLAGPLQIPEPTLLLRCCMQVPNQVHQVKRPKLRIQTPFPEGYTQGQFVLIKYEGKPYVRQIVAISMEGLQMNCMKQRGDKNGFVWPNRRDCIYYQDQEVVCGLSQPQQGSRYATLSKYDWLMYNGV